MKKFFMSAMEFLFMIVCSLFAAVFIYMLIALIIVILLKVTDTSFEVFLDSVGYFLWFIGHWILKIATFMVG